MIGSENDIHLDLEPGCIVIYGRTKVCLMLDPSRAYQLRLIWNDDAWELEAFHNGEWRHVGAYCRRRREAIEDAIDLARSCAAGTTLEIHAKIPGRPVRRYEVRED